MCEAVANVADAIFAGYLRLQMLFIEHARHPPRNLQHRSWLPAAYVENIIRGARRLQRQAATQGDVINTDKIALLETVFVNHRRFVVQQAGGKDSQHSGVWIGKRLPGSINVK